MAVGGQLLTPEKTRYPLYSRLGGPQGWSGRVRKISPPPEFDPRTVQPVASRHTDSAIPAPAHVGPNIKAQTTELINLNGRYHLVDLDVDEIVLVMFLVFRSETFSGQNIQNAGSCEHVTDRRGSIQEEDNSDQHRNYRPSTKDSPTWGQLPVILFSSRVS